MRIEWVHAFRCLLAAVACVAVAAGAQPLNLADGPDRVEPVGVGEPAPAFDVREVDGSGYRFDPGALDRPTVLITFRGGWCPYCNAQLSGLRDVLPALKAGGLDVLFLSADRPEILYSNLRDDTQSSIAGLDYHILSDAGLEAASALGIAYRVPDNTLADYEARGRDMADSSIERFGALPLPAVFIVAATGEIAFAYSNPDIRVRLPAEVLLEAAQPFMETD